MRSVIEMRIELVIDLNCFSIDMFVGMVKRLTRELHNKEINIVSFNSNEERMKKLGVRILPAWIIDDEVICVDPMDYNSVKNKIVKKLNHRKSYSK